MAYGKVAAALPVAVRFGTFFWLLEGGAHVSEFGLRKSLMAEVGMIKLSRHARNGEDMEI